MNIAVIKQPTYDSTPDARSLPRHEARQQWEVWYRTEDNQERSVIVTASIMSSAIAYVGEEYGEVLDIKKQAKPVSIPVRCTEKY